MGTIVDITLRTATPEDNPFYLRVYSSTRADEMALVDWNAAQKEAFLKMQFEAQRQFYLANYPEAIYYVIERAGQPVGRMIVDRSDKTIRLMDIALLPEHRNAGIGSGLIKELLEEADHANRPVLLHVETFNPAMKLYKRLGFVKSGELSFYHEMTRQPRGVEYAG